MRSTDLSATALRELLRSTQNRLKAEGRNLSEGAARVLGKLERIGTAQGLHRIYRRTGGSVMLLDLLSADELLQQGYFQTRHKACTVVGDVVAKQDRVTCWMSEVESTDELWVGQPLLP